MKNRIFLDVLDISYMNLSKYSEVACFDHHLILATGRLLIMISMCQRQSLTLTSKSPYDNIISNLCNMISGK